MDSLIFYLGTFYILVGTIFLTVPIIYLELGKPKDLIKAFLNLLIGLILIIKNKKDASDKYFFVTNNGRWTGFVDENILKTVSLKKWQRNFVGDFKKPIDSFESVSNNDKLWRTIEKLEETNEGFLLVLNAADIPLGIIDRSKIGNFVLNKLGFNLPSEIVKN